MRASRTWGRWLSRWWKPKDYAHVRHVESMADVPEGTGATIFLVGPAATPKWAVFECPCRRNHRLSVPLMRSARPHWTLRNRRGTVSLWPSIWAAANSCGSHFWLRDNRIEWALGIDDEP